MLGFINGDKILTLSQLLKLTNLTKIEFGNADYDLHSETESKILVFSRTIPTNGPKNFNGTYSIFVRLASNDSYDYVNWGVNFLLDPKENKIYMASDYGNQWSDWKEI